MFQLSYFSMVTLLFAFSRQPYKWMRYLLLTAKSVPRNIFWTSWVVCFLCFKQKKKKIKIVLPIINGKLWLEQECTSIELSEPRSSWKQFCKGGTDQFSQGKEIKIIVNESKVYICITRLISQGLKPIFFFIILKKRDSYLYNKTYY